MMVDWGELVPDLLTTIATKLKLYEDFTAFAGVCKSWQSVAVKNNFSPVQVPWLLLAPLEDSVNNERDFYSLTKGGMVHTVQLPQAGGGKKLFSCLGWLITLDEDGGDMELLHPLSTARISLPSDPKYDKFFDSLEKAALSASPSDTDDYTLMIVFGNILAYWKPGNTAWVTINTRPLFNDVVFHSSGRFYATNRRAELFSVDINGSDPTTITANLVGTLPSEVVSGTSGFYLAESSGHLLVIGRKLLFHNNQELPYFDFGGVAHYHDGMGGSGDEIPKKKIYNYMTTSFRVYRLEPSNNNWHVVNDLGGRSLFLSHNCAPVSIPCVVGTAIRPDCIYFTDDTNLLYGRKYDIDRRGIDMGVFSLKEERADTLFRGGTKGQRCLLCTPLWVIPSF